MSPLILLPWHLWYWWQYTVLGEKSVTLGNICKNTSWIDWAGQICWQIINKTEIERSALWEGQVQLSVAGVLVLISDWSISKSNDVMLVTTPYKENSIENQGSETVEIYLWSVSAIMTWNLEQRREVDLSNDTKLDLLFARLGAIVKRQTMCFPPKKNSKQRDKLW